MIRNGKSLLAAAPLSPMLDHKARAHGVSHGLTEAGFDLQIKQDVRFTPPDPFGYWEAMRDIERSAGDNRRTGEAVKQSLMSFHGYTEVEGDGEVKIRLGRFALASSIERFRVPANLVAIMGHKSTWARRGVNVWAGTTAEPGWEGWLTLEIGFHGNEPVHIPAGSGIAQVLFHELAEPGDYGGGKYANQPDRPVSAVMEGE